MASAELIVDVHHHYMPAVLFGTASPHKLAAAAWVPTKSADLAPFPERSEAHIKTMDEAGVTVSILTDSGQVMGAEVAKLLNDGSLRSNAGIPPVSAAVFIYLSMSRRAAKRTRARH
jgi:hypothetical protein